MPIAYHLLTGKLFLLKATIRRHPWVIQLWIPQHVTSPGDTAEGAPVSTPATTIASKMLSKHQSQAPTSTLN